MAGMRYRSGVQGLVLLVALVRLALGAEIDLPGLGRIEGTTSQSFWTNRTIYQYHRLPFAEPPMGSLRFKRPVKWNSPWSETRNCTDFGPICPQNAEPILENAVQSEDCLHLNVYTNKVGGGGVGQGLPVMFYVHGGSFRIGSSRNLPPTYLLEHDVILVTTQYRLGPFGFLSLNTDEIPGNQGLWDIALALEWVQDNIEHFGGDPSRVTLFGHSAGGAAVTLMLFSPFVKQGLFHRMIGQSGSALGTWVTDTEPVLHAKMIADLTPCKDVDHDDVAALAACLRDRPSPKQIVDAHTQFLVNDLAAGGRAVGGNHIVFNENGATSFFPKDPALLFDQGNFTRLPLMTGVTKHEGSWFVGNIYDLYLVPNNLTGSSPAAEEFMSMDMTKFALRFSGFEDRTGFAPSFLQNSYFTDEQLGNFTAMIPGLTDMMGVALLKASTFTLAQAMSRTTDTYLYSFNFFGRFTTFPDYPFSGGVAHSDELYYLFAKETGLNEREVEMARIMTRLWTSFATNGVPTAEGVVSWPKFSSPNGPYLRIELEPSAHDNFVRDEYMIAVHEGMTEYVADSAAQALEVSIITTVLALAILLH